MDRLEGVYFTRSSASANSNHPVIFSFFSSFFYFSHQPPPPLCSIALKDICSLCRDVAKQLNTSPDKLRPLGFFLDIQVSGVAVMRLCADDIIYTL